MLKRIVALGAAAVALSATPALAQQYPPEDDQRLEVSAMSPCPGDTITITAQTFAPGSAVLIDLVSDDVNLGSATADAEGTIVHDVTIPEDQTPGEYDIQVSGTTPDGEDVALTAAIEVRDCDETTAAPAAATPSEDLPRTGSSTTMTLVKIGAGLAAAGGVLLALVRRRNRNAGLNPA